jgi:hypothetical protein
MICLGCGQDCPCLDPTSFVSWPLQESLEVEDLYFVESVLNSRGASPAIQNTANAIRAFLQKYEASIEREFWAIVNQEDPHE